LRADRAAKFAVAGSVWAGLGIRENWVNHVAQELEFVPYTHDWTGAVRDFNDRLVADGLESELRFPEEPRLPVPHNLSGTLYQEDCLAVEGAMVRGAYLFTRERWVVRGQLRHVAHFRHPVSEGLVNRRYKGVGTSLLNHALQKCSLLYSLGMGHSARPLPRMLASQNWSIAPTSFYFRCLRPSRVLRNLACLRTHPRWRFIMDTAAWTGMGSIGISGMQHFRTRRPTKAFTVSVVRDFADEADEILKRATDAYSLLVFRDSQTLRRRYPAPDSRFLRLVVDSGSGPCGWAVVLPTPMRGHKQFGDLRVGTIVDCLALPGEEDYVIHAATRLLEAQGLDLIVSNQSHRNWCRALEDAGFLSGPSNYIFAASPQLASLLEPFANNFPAAHLTRGDGAGPIHL
jgi:hypothetical protein